MIVGPLIAMLVGATVSALTWPMVEAWFDSVAFQRANYRQALVPTAVGVLIPLVMTLAAGVDEVIVQRTGSYPSWELLVGPSLLAGIGFGLLGLLDDLAGVGQSGGFRGHVAALGSGRLTSGMVKLLGGAAVGVVVAASVTLGDDGVAGLLRDGAIVALAANLANLFDRAPGRVIKVSALGFFVTLLVATSTMQLPTMLVPMAVGVGAGVGLLRVDLNEKAMLGDAGANPLGALCGMAVLLATPSSTVRWLLAGILLALNLVSEVVSFSRIIDAVPPLRYLDRLGSQRH